MRTAIYLRVSTDQQTTDNQRRDLEAAIEQRGWTLTRVYEDKGISGAKGRDDRPAFDRMHQDAIRGEFDAVAAWSVDRLGRSLRDLIGCLETLNGAHVGLYLHRQAIDTTTSAGRMLFQLLGVFAEFERAIICERVRAGQARAKAAGKRIGGSNPIPAPLVRRVVELRESGLSIPRIVKLTGVSQGSVGRICSQVTSRVTG